MGKRIYIKQSKSSPDDLAFEWNNEVKYQAVQMYCQCGNMKMVSDQTKVPYNTVLSWKKTAWWDEMVRAIRGEGDIKVITKVSQLLDRALETLEDRIASGDYQYNPQTGELVRVPVKAQVLNQIQTSLSKQRIEYNNQPTEHQIDTKEATTAKLAQLADAFTAFTKGKKIKDTTGERVGDEYEVLTDGTVVDGFGQPVSEDRINVLETRGE